MEPTKVVKYTNRVQQVVDYVLSPLSYKQKTAPAASGRSSLTDSWWRENTLRSYNGPFAFSTNDAGNIVVSPGFVNHNGEVWITEETELTPQTGYIVVCNFFDENTHSWGGINVKFGIITRNGSSYPLGYCKVSNDGRIDSLTCYEVEMATLLITRNCPLAGGG